MKLSNPKITIQNANGPHWLVSIDHRANDEETISFTVLVKKTTLPLGDIQQAALDRCIHLLQALDPIPGMPG